MRILVKLLTVLIIIVVLFVGAYKLMNARTYQLFGGLTSHVETNKKVVALTFDDGPTKNVEQILDLLDQYDAKATFFVIGNELEKNPKEGEKIAKAGHQIGNHTYSHKRMIFKSPTYIQQEILKTSDLIRATGYEGEIDFRPPNGKKLVLLPYYLMKDHMDTITWNLEPDTYYSTVTEKVNDVITNITPGSIILLHPMYDHTGEELEVVKEILEQLTAKGYNFITVNELQQLGQ